MSNPDEAHTYLVIGGGPAATGAALALSDRGAQVTIIDAGLTLDPDREQVRERLAATPPAQWSPGDLERAHYAGGAGNSLAIKYLFGSDVAFRSDGALSVERDADVGAVASYARGGLSNVWGAGVLTYTEQDLKDWPISASELGTHAAAVMQKIPYSAAHDRLEALYPILREPDGLLERSFIGQAVKTSLERHAEMLESAGYQFGAARLAVRSGQPAPEKGCVYCRHCLDGCPYDHIYNARFTLEELETAGRIRYRNGLHVDRVLEADNRVTVEATDLSDNSAVRLDADRVFLAAGSLSSTMILQRSHLLARRVELLDSQTMFVPMLWTGRVGSTATEPTYTLAQLFVLQRHNASSNNPIHASLYTYNESLLDRARVYRPRLSSLFGPVFRHLAQRLVVAICFLHSEDSGTFTSELLEEHEPKMRLTAKVNPRTSAVTKSFQASLVRTLPRIGLVPLVPFTERAAIGGGFHFGGSMPMRAQPGPGEADLLGRPTNSMRIHVVDASCFPAIPAGTITLPIMANAHRIAMAVAKIDGV